MIAAQFRTNFPDAQIVSCRTWPKAVAVVSVQLKNLIASPKTLIVLFGVVGAFVWGVPGLFGGLATGFILTSLIGIARRGNQARRRVCMELSKKVIVSFPDVVGAAFPDLAEDRLERAVEEHVEKLCGAAVRISPGYRLAWPSPEMRMARFKLETETESEALLRLYDAILLQMEKEWYSVA